MPLTETDVLVEIQDRLCRWIANFNPSDRRLYRTDPGAPVRIIGPPVASGRLTVQDLLRRGLVGAYEPVGAPTA